jgi:hypothetical protein
MSPHESPQAPTSNMTLTPYNPQVDQVARFQSLQPGQYWRATEAVPEEGIEPETVLLIQSIRWVDDAPHTIILRPHPSMIGKRVDLQVPQDDGATRRVHFLYDEHRFLLDDFLTRFEFEPDHQRIRGEEIRRVQGRITELQSELLEAQTNPTLLAAVIEEGMRATSMNEQGSTTTDASSQSQGPDAAGPTTALISHGDAVAMASGTVANAIGAGLTAQGVSAMRAAAGREHKIATIKSQWIQGKTSEIATTIMGMTPFYEEQAAAALAQTEDVRSYVAKLLQGIESLDLYVGKGVEVLSVRSGASAARDIPLTFVQRKLMMDEELAVWTDIDEQFDFESEELFFKALRDHDELVHQIFPTERCVLVMATTRRHIEYGNPFTNMARNDENRKVFLMVRDGMNIHRVFSPVESHLGSQRLFPSKDDQERAFRGLDGEKIRFEDVAYTDKLAAHESMALHYKRFLLLVCGLDHRLKLFGDFYEGPQSFRFVSMAFQEQNCRFLHDDDESMMLPGPDERPAVSAWIAEKNSYLRSGSRVLCKWGSVMNPTTAPGACKRNQRSRGFEFRYSPKPGISVAIAYREGESFCVDVEVSGFAYSSGSDRTFNCKVNLSAFENGEWEYEDQPFLCLDAVEPEDLRWYILHRDSRRNHLDYIRFFKRALRHVLDERDHERASRERLAQAMADGNVASPAERPAIIDQAIIAWRAANRGSPLPSYGDAGAEAAWKALLDQLFMLAGEGKRKVAEVEEFARVLGLIPLRLVLSSGAKLVVYAAPLAEEREDRLEPHAWVHRITLERSRTRLVEKARRWTLLPKQAASETTLHQWPSASDWTDLSSSFPSHQRKAAVLARATDVAQRLAPLTRSVSKTKHTALLDQWLKVRTKMLKDAKYVRDPVLVIPFGVVQFPKSGEARYLCLGSRHAEALLYRLAPDDESRESVRNAYIKPFARKDRGREEFEKSLAHFSWSLFEAALSLADESNLFVHDSTGVPISVLDGQDRSQPLLADWFARWAKVYPKYRVWIDDGAMANGVLALDRLVGNKLPDDFEPLRILEIALEPGDGNEELSRVRWFDICPQPPVRTSRDPWEGMEDVKQLVVDAGYNPDAGYGCQMHLRESLSQARALVAEQVKDRYGNACRASLWSDVDGAPAPPDGTERWIVVDGGAA